MTEPRAAGSHDFVDRLVAKAFGTPDAAAPRVPSTYEPTPPGRAGMTPPGAASSRGGDDDPGGATRMAMSGLDWADTALTERDADASGARASAAGSSRTAASEMTADASSTRQRGAASSDRASAAHDAGGALSSVSLRSLLSRSALSPGSSMGAHDADAGTHAGDGSLVAAHVQARPLGTVEGDGQAHGIGAHSASTAQTGATAQAAARDTADDRGALGRSPFDLRTAEEARARAALDSLRRDDAHDRETWRARLGEREDRARESAARHRDLDDAQAPEGTLLARDRGLALRIGDGAASRGDGWPSRLYGDDRSADAEVTVNVTIGRVDVRAVQAAASREQPARGRGPQPLALDDYLTQRGGAR